MTHGSLFSGIGGFDLAAEWMGWENKFHCEINEFCQKILKHYWPNTELYGDIKQTDFTIWNGRIDILTGGFPCQPYSQTGKRKGKEDDRHLWPEMLRAIREIQPRWVVGENVSGLLNWKKGMVLDEIKTDLETEGFEVLPPLILPACGINASHRRDRCWIIAHSNNERFSGSIERFGNGRREAKVEKPIKEFFPCKIASSYNDLPKPVNFGGNDGFPGRLDSPTISKRKWREESIKAFGNSVVPHLVLQIFKTIEQTHQ